MSNKKQFRELLDDELQKVTGGDILVGIRYKIPGRNGCGEGYFLDSHGACVSKSCRNDSPEAMACYKNGQNFHPGTCECF